MTESTPFFADFLDWRCQILTARYETGSPAILLADAETGEHIATATVNVGFQPPLGIVFIKTWSENEGIDKALIAAGVLKPGVIARHPTGFVEALAYRLTPAFVQALAVQKILATRPA